MEDNEKKWLEEHCHDMGKYPLVFDLSKNPEVVLPKHPDYFVYMKESPKVEIELTSWRGISLGAIHYYATLNVESWQICSIDPDGRRVSHVGYMGEAWDKLPKETRDLFNRIRIEACRPVTQEDIEKDPERWEGYRVGYHTNAFETKEAALAVATQIYRMRCCGWEMEIEDLC